MPTITGTNAHDELAGTTADDTILGLGGDDTLRADPGDDTIDGGSGRDTVRYDAATSGVTVDLHLTDAQIVGGGMGVDVLTGIEDVVGSPYDDVLIGTDDAEPVMISLGAPGFATMGDMSPDATRVAFTYYSPRDGAMVYIRNLETGAVSPAVWGIDGNRPAGYVIQARFAADGHHVIFRSEANNLVATDGNRNTGYYIVDLDTGQVDRFLPNLMDARWVTDFDLSPDRDQIIFSSSDPALVAGDTNGRSDVFVADIASGAAVRVSVNSGGGQLANDSLYGLISEDGSRVTFWSRENLTDFDTHGYANAYVRDLTTGQVTRIGPAPQPEDRNFHVLTTAMSPDGAWVNGFYERDVGQFNQFLQNLNTGEIIRLGGYYAEFSPNSRYVAFTTYGPTDYVYKVYDLVERAIVATGLGMVDGWSSDGLSLIVTTTVARGNGDENGERDVYLLPAFGPTGNTLSGGAGDDHLSGLGGDDILLGGSGADMLEGGTGNDSLDGGSGADRMAGGAGNDLYGVENVGDIVTELANQGTDTVKTNLDGYVLGANVENLTLTGSGNISGTGNDLNNVMIGNGGNNTLNSGKGDDQLYGGAGDDILNSGTGADRMYGGAGNDIYYYGVGDTIIEAADAGIDTVYASVNFTIGSTLENLVLIGDRAINGTGNNLGNRMQGNDQANVLQGGRGNDALYGQGGDDILIGGRDADTLGGGAGADTFRFDVMTDSLVAGADTIIDYQAELDRLDLSRLDADSLTAGDQAFHQVAAFTHHAGELTLSFDAGTNRTTLSLDMNGDGNADMAILFVGQVTSTAGWLL